MSNKKNKLSPIEGIKQKSKGLRGTMQESLEDELTGSIREDDQSLIKFHGMYQQDDRDRREERALKKLDRLYSFMVRLRLPGGFLSPEQWVATNDIAGEHATGVIKITSRQTIQLHGILKARIKPTLQAFNKVILDAIAACGDVNRNVLCSSHPRQSAIHEEVFRYADKISELLKPKTRAYYEIWLNEEKIAERSEEDPLYQNRYLPRKFKIAIAIPPNNDVDVLANDIGLIAIIEDNKLLGFNIAVGGGLSTTHGNPETYARLATVIGFTDTEEKTLKAVYEVLTIQRDFGDRSNRKKARLKYTVDAMGINQFKEELEQRTGFALEAARPYTFTERADYYGWEQDHNGLWHYTLLVENGRVLDTPTLPMKSALLAIAKTGKATFRFTCSQNLMLNDIQQKDKAEIDTLLRQYQLIQHTDNSSALRKNAMACVAMPTCPLALAEAQRYLPELISKVEPLLEKYGLQQEDIIMRMTGCPNGCARSYLAEIGFVGTGPGRYNLHLGGDREGLRLNSIYKENISEHQILEELDLLLDRYQKEKQAAETFGDYCFRKNIAIIP
ncbi:MAG: assimilatory sulfite reductase (NADPH) hemoprotein subunit [Taibaiella sp.]|jgi:sulfite reductase (NADPH) hemoprotein beta-component